MPYLISAYFIHFLFSGNLKEKLILIKKSKYVWITSSYYLFLIIGCLYSSQIYAALFDLEVKFSLLIFPIMLSSKRLSQKEFSTVIAWFLAGCFMAFLICLSYAFLFFFATNDVSLFYYSKLSVFHHPTYFSMYLNFAILVLYFYLIFDKEAFVIQSVTLYVILIVLFSLFVVLLSSKIGLITLLLIIFFGTLFWLLKSRAIFPSIMVFTMLTTMIYISFKYSSIIQGRIQEAIISLEDNEEVHLTTTGARLVIWGLAYDMIKEKPLIGYGTGDVKYELIELYKKFGYTHLEKARLNAHNQYLQMLIAIGIIGSILFWLYMYYPFIEPMARGDFIYAGFTIIVTLNFLTESMLETQAGVVFFAFFNSILFFNRDKVIPVKLKKL